MEFGIITLTHKIDISNLRQENNNNNKILNKLKDKEVIQDLQSIQSISLTILITIMFSRPNKTKLLVT
jgi:hypothetical protein